MNREAIPENIRGIAFRLLLCIALAGIGQAGAAVTVSTKATKNIACNADYVCTPSKTDAVLNVTDLTTMLMSSSVVISTSPAVSPIATDIVIGAPIAWSTGSLLTLDSHESVTVKALVTVAGSGGLEISTNDGGSGGSLSFGPKGSVTFANTADLLLIDNEPYVLVSSPADFARAIAGNPSGHFALAAPYDAAGDSYTSAPVPTVFTGIFEGLGNRITHLAIHDALSGDPAALFAHIGPGGELHDLELMPVDVSGTSPVGGAVAINEGLVTGSIVDGSVTAKLTDATAVGNTTSLIVGGLVGENEGTVSYSHATPTVTGTVSDPKGEGISAYAGGLVGLNQGSGATITAASAGGAVNLTVSSKNAASHDNNLGGLVGENVLGSILAYSFAVGSVSFDGTCIKCGSTTGLGDSAGGLIGTNDNGVIDQASASGSVVAGDYGTAGGLIGTNQNAGLCTCGWIDATVATGSVSASTVGGLLGYNYEIPVSDSTSSGVVSGGLFSNHSIGGFVGFDASPQPSPYFTNDSWNMTTSGITDPTMGAGNVPSDPGITGFN